MGTGIITCLNHAGATASTTFFYFNMVLNHFNTSGFHVYFWVTIIIMKDIINNNYIKRTFKFGEKILRIWKELNVLEDFYYE